MSKVFKVIYAQVFAVILFSLRAICENLFSDFSQIFNHLDFLLFLGKLIHDWTSAFLKLVFLEFSWFILKILEIVKRIVLKHVLFCFDIRFGVNMDVIHAHWLLSGQRIFCFDQTKIVHKATEETHGLIELAGLIDRLIFFLLLQMIINSWFHRIQSVLCHSPDRNLWCLFSFELHCFFFEPFHFLSER